MESNPLLVQYSIDDRLFAERLVQDNLYGQELTYMDLLLASEVPHVRMDNIKGSGKRHHSFLSKFKINLIILTELRILLVAENKLLRGRSIKSSFSFLRLKKIIVKGDSTEGTFELRIGFKPKDTPDSLDWIVIIGTAQRIQNLVDRIYKQSLLIWNGRQDFPGAEIDVPGEFYKHFDAFLDTACGEHNRSAIMLRYYAFCDFSCRRPHKEIVNYLKSAFDTKNTTLNLFLCLGLNSRNKKAWATLEDTCSLMRAIEYSSFFERINAINFNFKDERLGSIAFPLAHNATLTQYSLRMCGASKLTAKVLGDAIAHRTSPLVKLKIESCDIGNEGVSFIIDGLITHGTGLEVLSLSKCGIDSLKVVKELTMLMDSTKWRSSLRILNLCGNDLGLQGEAELGTFLDKKSVLQKLFVSNCGFKGEYLLQALCANHQVSLQLLDLSRNGLSKKSYKMLVGLLQLTKTLSTIFLDQSGITRDDSSRIFEAMTSNRTGVQFSVGLSFNNLESSTIKVMSDLVSKMSPQKVPNIKGLDLSSNKISIEDMATLCKQLTQFRDLEAIDLSCNIKLTSIKTQKRVGTALREMVAMLPTLRELHLNGDGVLGFNGKVLAPLLKDLSTNGSLAKLSIQNNGLKRETISILLESLHNNSKLWVLDIDQNRLSTKAIKALYKIACKHSTLKALNFENDLEHVRVSKSAKEEFARIQEGARNRMRENQYDSNVIMNFLFADAHRDDMASRTLTLVNDEKSEDSTSLDRPSWSCTQFGVKLDSLDQASVSGYVCRIPSVLVFLERFMLRNNGFRVPCIFKLGPSKHSFRQIKEELMDGSFDSTDDFNALAANVVYFFKAFPTPLLDGIDIAEISEPFPNIENIIAKLSEFRSSLFLWLVDLCVYITSLSYTNALTDESLSISFSNSRELTIDIVHLFNNSTMQPFEAFTAARAIKHFFVSTIEYRRVHGLNVKRSEDFDDSEDDILDQLNEEQYSSEEKLEPSDKDLFQATLVG